jgi:hypothetical protein
MPSSRRECKGHKLEKLKPRFQESRVPAIVNESRLHTVFLFGTIAQEAESGGGTMEFRQHIFFMDGSKSSHGSPTAW